MIATNLTSMLTPIFSNFPGMLAAVTEEAPRDLVSQLIHSNLFNVLLALGIITWLFNKFNILGSLDNHGVKIAEELSQAEADRKAAQAALKTTQVRLTAVNHEVETILKQAQHAAEQLASQILHYAEEEASRIVETARQRVLLEERSGAKNLQARLLKETVVETRYQLENRLVDPHDRRRTIEQFIKELPALPLAQS